MTTIKTHATVYDINTGEPVVVPCETTTLSTKDLEGVLAAVNKGISNAMGNREDAIQFLTAVEVYLNLAKQSVAK